MSGCFDSNKKCYCLCHINKCNNCKCSEENIYLILDKRVKDESSNQNNINKILLDKIDRLKYEIEILCKEIILLKTNL